MIAVDLSTAGTSVLVAARAVQCLASSGPSPSAGVTGITSRWPGSLTSNFTYVDSRGSRFDVVVPDLDSEAVRDVLKANLGPEALRVCLGILATSRAIAVTAGELAIATEDGGMTIEFTDGPGSREVVFAVPDDGAIRYFVARGPRAFRKAGVVVDDAGVRGLAQWLAGKAPFPSSGLLVGARSRGC